MSRKTMYDMSQPILKGNHEYRFEDAFIKSQFENAVLKAKIEELQKTITQLEAYEQITGIKLEKIEAK